MEYRMEEIKYKMKDFDGYGIWKISIPFHSLACPGFNI